MKVNKILWTWQYCETNYWSQKRKIILSKISLSWKIKTSRINLCWYWFLNFQTSFDNLFDKFAVFKSTNMVKTEFVWKSSDKIQF